MPLSKNKPLTYDVTPLENGVSQYGAEVFTANNNAADAVYIDHENPLYANNILAAAIPPVPSRDVIKILNTGRIPQFKYDTEVQKSDMSQIADLSMLNQFRVPLLHHNTLAHSIHEAMMDGAVNRFLHYDCTQNILVHANGQDVISHTKSYTNEGGVSGHFLLVGTAGTGKTTALASALSYYPQVLYHHPHEIPEMVQVTYIVAECPTNSNLKGMYAAIAAAYDKALKNMDCFHENECQKLTQLNDREIYIRRLIDQYHTLLIIIDEIQNIDVSNNKPNSFGTLIKLKNETKISLAFCGLESACDKLLQNLALARRVKTRIDSTVYTKSKKLFSLIVISLFQYQWFNPRVKVPTDTAKASKEWLELVDALYRYTGGIIDQLMSLYKMMNYEFIHSEKKPTIDADFVRKVSNKFFPNILEVLNNIDNEYEKQQARARLVTGVDEMLAAEKKREDLENAENDVDKQIAELNNMKSKRKTRICNEVTEVLLKILPEKSFQELVLMFDLVYDPDSNMKASDYTLMILKQEESWTADGGKKKAPVKKQSNKVDPIKNLDEILDNNYQPLAVVNSQQEEQYA